MLFIANKPPPAVHGKLTQGDAVKRDTPRQVPKQETDLKIKLDYVVRAPTPLGQRYIPATEHKK